MTGAEVAMPVLLASCRVAGVAAFAPALAGAAVPVRVRAALALALAALAAPAAVRAGIPEAAVVEPWRLAPAALVEFALGAVIGTVAMLPVAAFRTAGALAGMQMGIGFGAACGARDAAESDGASEPVAHALAILAVALFVWGGGLDAVALSTLRSFDFVALGAWSPRAGAVAVLAGAMLSASDLALRVALPVTVVLVTEALLSGFVARAVPGVALLSFGFPVRVCAGLLALLAGAAAMQSAMSGAVAGLLDSIHAAVAGGTA
jgi:flagellar biosynthetic protein FliR